MGGENRSLLKQLAALLSRITATDLVTKVTRLSVFVDLTESEPDRLSRRSRQAKAEQSRPAERPLLGKRYYRWRLQSFGMPRGNLHGVAYIPAESPPRLTAAVSTSPLLD